VSVYPASFVMKSMIKVKYSNNHNFELQRYNELYETALRPTSLQKRQMTKSESVALISRETRRRIDDTIDRLRIIQD
jgi:hypothetical protein